DSGKRMGWAFRQCAYRGQTAAQKLGHFPSRHDVRKVHTLVDDGNDIRHLLASRPTGAQPFRDSPWVEADTGAHAEVGNPLILHQVVDRTETAVQQVR